MKTKDQVYYILSAYPETRNSDRELRKQYGKVFYGLTDEQVKVFDLFDPETLRRNRQKIQEGGLYPADKKIKKYRDELQDEVKDDMGYLTKKNIGIVIDDKMVQKQAKLLEVRGEWN